MLVAAKQKAASKSDCVSIFNAHGGSDQREKMLETVVDRKYVSCSGDE
jgi:hypothetical protein